MCKEYPFLDLGKVNEPYMEDLIKAATNVIRSGRYIGGEEVEGLEQDLEQLLGVRNVVGVSNGLDALRLILRAYIEAGVMEKGDEVIVPANTYIASFLAVTDTGLIPVAVDVDIRTMNIDPGKIEDALTAKTKAIMPVHLYGRVAWDKRMVEIAERKGLKLIEDCAQAIGARAAVKGRNGSYHAGALGDAGAISFYPTKNLGALGDAGAVVTNDDALAATVRALANYGTDKRYHNIYCGWNCRLDPIQAAMLRKKLRSLTKENADRFERALAYHRTIKREDVVIPEMSNVVIDNVWHQYVIRVLDGKRDRMRTELGKLGIGTDIHYPIPPHKQQCYEGLTHGDLSVTEQLASEILSLPIAGISVKDAAEIGEVINGLKIE